MTKINKPPNFPQHDPTDWQHCTACPKCNATRKGGWVVRPVLALTVPGGANDTPEHRMHVDFDKDMNAYRDAKADGIQPDQVSAKSVKAAQDRVKSQEAALRVSHKVGIDFGENVKVAKGVDKDVVGRKELV